jgi:hypothetical protein
MFQILSGIKSLIFYPNKIKFAGFVGCIFLMYIFQTKEFGKEYPSLAFWLFYGTLPVYLFLLGKNDKPVKRKPSKTSKSSNDLICSEPTYFSSQIEKIEKKTITETIFFRKDEL